MKKIGLVCAGILICFGLSLVLDRALGRFLSSRGYFKAMTPDVTEIYDSNEFSYTAHISSQGIRNPVVGPKPKGTIRVLAVGDSFTFGWGNDPAHTWVSLVESVAQASGQKVEIINAGMPGADIDTYGGLCRLYADRFGADIIVVGLYTDDLYEALITDVWQVRVVEVIQSLWPTFTSLNLPVLGSNRWPAGVRTGATVRAKDVWRETIASDLRDTPSYLSRVAPAVRPYVLDGDLPPPLVGFARLQQDYLTYLLYPGEAAHVSAVAASHMTKLRACAGSRPVLVVYFPSSELVSATYLPYKQELGYDVSPELTTLPLDRYLAPAVHAQGFQFVSLLSEFRRDGCPGCYFPYDGHLTPLGSQRAAPVITGALLPIVTRLESRIKGR